MERKRNALAFIGFISLLLIPLALSHSDENFVQAESIINQKTPCTELSESQLELIGDYYMEQIHPGEQHEAMDEMMGGEGSDSLAQMHIAMAYRFYCAGQSGEANQYYGMMGSGSNYGMMRGMMNGNGISTNHDPEIRYNNSGLETLGAINSVLFSIALVVIIVFLGIKISKEFKGGKK